MWTASRELKFSVQNLDFRPLNESQNSDLWYIWLHQLSNKLLQQLTCVSASCVHKASSKPVVVQYLVWFDPSCKSDCVSKFIDISDLWLRSLKGRHAEVKLGEWGGGKHCALGCPAKSSVFPDKAASSYTGRHLNVLLFPLGGYLSVCWDFTILAPQAMCRCLVQSNCVSCWVLVIDSGRNMCFS